MSSHTKRKVEGMHVGKSVKQTASALVSDVKEIARDTKKAATDTLAHARKNAKELLQKAEKKWS